MTVVVVASGAHPLQPVDHAQLAAAVPEDRVATVEEHGLVVAVDGDVVADAVRDHGVGRAHDGHRPAVSLRGDHICRAIHDQGGIVAVHYLLEALTYDMGVPVLGMSGRWRGRRGGSNRDGTRAKWPDDGCPLHRAPPLPGRDPLA